jgi:hypothetical protein
MVLNGSGIAVLNPEKVEAWLSNKNQQSSGKETQGRASQRRPSVS